MNDYIKGNRFSKKPCKYQPMKKVGEDLQESSKEDGFFRRCGGTSRKDD